MNQPFPVRIERFAGEWRFLSNFFPAPTTIHGIRYPTSEHAYQAQKAVNDADRLTIAALPRPGMAKREGRRVLYRDDWEAVKDFVMYDVVRAKFDQNPVLLRRLLDTGPAVLVEGNAWGDRYWGVCGGRGLNRLGTILMRVRENTMETMQCND